MRVNGLFDLEFRLEELSRKGDPLESLNTVIDWEQFRAILHKALRRGKKQSTGRPPFDAVLILKVLILQSLYNLSDAQAEYQIKDRLSFMRFLGLNIGDRVPDEKTIWHYREQFRETKVLDKIFERFNRTLEASGYVARGGSIIDASIVEAPRQRNSREENAAIKKGETPEEWQQNASKLRQKDLDGRWLKQRGKSYYGYKNHVGIDKRYKIIRKYCVTAASTHDGTMLQDLLDPSNSNGEVYADSAYYAAGAELPEGYRNRINRKGYRNRPLSEREKQGNRTKSRTRARVEHTFAWLKQSIGIRIRSIGIERATTYLTLANLTYNMKRCEYLTRVT